MGVMNPEAVDLAEIESALHDPEAAAALARARGHLESAREHLARLERLQEEARRARVTLRGRGWLIVRL